MSLKQDKRVLLRLSVIMQREHERFQTELLVASVRRNATLDTHLFDRHLGLHHDALVARVLRVVVAEGRSFQGHWLRRRRLLRREAHYV